MPRCQKRSQSHCTELVLGRHQRLSYRTFCFTWFTLPTPNMLEPTGTALHTTRGKCRGQYPSLEPLLPSWKLVSLLPALASPKCVPCSLCFYTSLAFNAKSGAGRRIWVVKPRTCVHALNSREMGKVPSSLFGIYSGSWPKSKETSSISGVPESV